MGGEGGEELFIGIANENHYFPPSTEKLSRTRYGMFIVRIHSWRSVEGMFWERYVERSSHMYHWKTQQTG